MPQKQKTPSIIMIILFATVVGYTIYLSNQLTELKKEVGARTADNSVSTPPAETEEAELAPFMTELATYMHKLQLAIDNRNSDLALFYSYEAEEILNEIKTKAPNYGGHDIDGLIKKMLDPHIKELRPILKDANNWLQDPKVITTNWKKINARFDKLITSCNACHQSTHHAYIKISRNPETPFLNKFNP